MENTVLVTGGAGFAGSAVVEQLLIRDKESRIVVLDRLVTGKREFLAKSNRITLVEADLRDGMTMKDLFAEIRPTAVIHLAAIHFIPYCNAHPTEALEVNVAGTQNVLEACRVSPPQRLVIASSAAVYPIWDDASSEEHPAPAPTDIYGLTKWVNEEQLRLYAEQTKTRCAAARLFNIYGPRETNPHILPEILHQMLAGNCSLGLGNVKPKRDYIYVTDVARALISLAERNEHSFRQYNVGTGIEYSVEDLVDRLAKISGMALRIDTDPAKVRKSDRMHLLCDNQRIQREIGWQPEFDMTRGLADLWKWATENPELVRIPFAGKV